MLQNTKKIFASIGFALNEIKKSFLLSTIYFIVTAGITYLFFLILFGIYNNISNNYSAVIFCFMCVLFVFILSIILFTILNKIKRICLIRVINYEIKSKEKDLLQFIDSFLDSEAKMKGKDLIKNYFRFIFALVVISLLAYFIFGLWNIITTIWIKVIVFVILGLLFMPLTIFITRYSFYVKSLNELVLSYRIFANNYLSVLFITIISFIPIILIGLLYLFLHQYVALQYILMLLLIASVTIAVYLHFFVISFIFLEKK